MGGLPSNALAPLLLIVFLASLCPASAGLPGGWSDTDIGAPADAGSASYNTGVWKISGGGADIWNSADQFNFASQSFNCDGAVVALVTSVQNSDPGSGWSKTGVMFRNDTTPGAANVFMTAAAGRGVAFPDSGPRRGHRPQHAGQRDFPPVWVKVVRSSDLFSGYYSFDGTNWIQVGSTTTIEMNGPALAGLAVSAHQQCRPEHLHFCPSQPFLTTFGIYPGNFNNLNPNVGNTLAVLTNATDNPNWPNNPVASYTHVFTNFETEINTGMDNYGQRLRTFVVPPVSGLYTFWIASDDSSQLFLSTNESPASMVPIAQQTSWDPSEDWTGTPVNNRPSSICKGAALFSGISHATGRWGR